MLQFSHFAQEGAHPPLTPTPYSYIVNDGFPPPPKFRILDRTLAGYYVLYTYRYNDNMLEQL